MTHDELLEKIRLKFFVNEEGATGSGYKESQLRNAVYAVVELHKPWSMETGPEGDPETKTVIGCSCIPELPAFLNPWPCKTIQAIEKELA
jgi:hypothetical protein